MDQSIQVRELVATMLRIPPDRLVDGTSLASLHTSLDDARLKLGLKRLGLPPLTAIRPATFGQLQAALGGTSLAPAEETANSSAATKNGTIAEVTVVSEHAASGVQVGVDVQDIESLPAADDYWVHEFYVGMFAKSEIAYAVTQSEPRIHLTGCWCAKEALRKCDANFQSIDFRLTAVAHESSGRPYLVRQMASGPVRLPHALSLSHTREVATAVVVLAPLASPSIPSTPSTTVTVPPPPSDLELARIAGQAKRPSLAGAIVGAVTLIAIGALGATLFLHYLKP
jgi:phosphopantetheinyl transferase (holo-ACP synthase)